MLYKRPESVLVVIYTVSLEVLLLQRRDVPDFWQSVTGSLKMTETPLSAAQREVWEETGLTGQYIRDCHQVEQFAIRPPWRDRYAPSVTHNTEHVFTLSLSDRLPICLNPREHVAYEWLSYSLALEKANSFTNRKAILNWVARR